jgi:hypothetical protein
LLRNEEIYSVQRHQVAKIFCYDLQYQLLESPNAMRRKSTNNEGSTKQMACIVYSCYFVQCQLNCRLNQSNLICSNGRPNGKYSPKEKGSWKSLWSDTPCMQNTSDGSNHASTGKTHSPSLHFSGPVDVSWLRSHGYYAIYLVLKDRLVSEIKRMN